MLKYLHVNIIARDWRKLSDFYQNVFGCIPMDPIRDYTGEYISAMWGVEGLHVEGNQMEVPGYGEGGPTLEIFSVTPNKEGSEQKVNEFGFGHICFEVDDVMEYIEKILANGGSMQSTFDDLPSRRCVFMRDPEGNIVEIHLPAVKKDYYRVTQ